MRSKRSVEGDSVLQVLRWLNRTPESFVPGYDGPAFGDEALPRIEPTKMLRFDAQAIYEQLKTTSGSPDSKRGRNSRRRSAD